jgi:hypothetical protein
MTKTEIINETIAFYNSTNRGYDEAEDICVYLTPNGNKCAVGRCMTNGAIEKCGMTQASIGNLIEVHNLASIDDILKPEYRGHGLRFWKDLQHFHDDCSLWNKDGFRGEIPNHIQRYLDSESVDVA